MAYKRRILGGADMPDRYCEICGTTRNLHRHHVFGASNRKFSERHGLVMDLCLDHHTGNKGIHFNKKMDLFYKKKYQKKFESEHPNGHELWMQTFRRNYLDEDYKSNDQVIEDSLSEMG